MKNQQFPPEVEADLREYREKGPGTARLIGLLVVASAILIIKAISILL